MPSFCYLQVVVFVLSRRGRNVAKPRAREENVKFNIYEVENPGTSHALLDGIVVAAPCRGRTSRPRGDTADVKAAMGERIGSLRKDRFETIEAFANAVGLNPAYAWRVEAGRQNLSLTTLCRISAALHVQLADLFIGIDSFANEIAAATEGGERP